MLKNKSLCVFLAKMSEYRKDFDEIRYISLLIKDDELLEKYNKILEKVKNCLRKKLIVNQYTMKNI